MMFVLHMLILCMIQVSDLSYHERKDQTMGLCQHSLSQITLECDKCMNQDWCRKWYDGSPAPGAKCFDLCNSITNQIQCLSNKIRVYDEIELEKKIGKLGSELEKCTGNFELATINNQTTIKSVNMLNESLNNLSISFKAFYFKQHQHADNTDVQLRGLKSQIHYFNRTVERKFSERMNEFELKITRLFDEQNNNIGNSVENVSRTLQAVMLKENTRIKKQLMSNIGSSESNIKMNLAELNQTNDEKINKIKRDQFESQIRLNTTIQELFDSVRNVNKSSVLELEKVKKHFEQILKNLQKELDGHKSQLGLLKTQLKSDFNDVITTVTQAWNKTLNSMSKDLEQKLEENNVNMTQKLTKFENKTYSIETNLQTLKDVLQRQISKVKNKLRSSMYEQRSSLELKIEEQSQKLNKHIQVINDRVTQINEDIERKLNDKAKRLEDSNKLIQDIVEKKARELESKMAYKYSNIKEKVDIIYPNTFNKEMLQMAFLCLVVLVIINFAMVFYYRPASNMAHTVGNAERRFQSSIEILRQVPSKPQLQAAVCIISFDEGRQAAHLQLLDSANLTNYRVVTFVVRRHSNIPDLPRCKVYLMCTEFSERHVIIEEQGLGLGDLHRTTYDAVLKLGGQLIILYTRDPGSRRLKDDEVYNKNIYCVTHQEELVELNNTGRFFSVYDALTTQQKTKLKQTIMECFH